MQPRKDLLPRLEMVFQVMTRGCSSSCCMGEGCLERPGMEKKDDLEDDLEVSPRAT